MTIFKRELSRNKKSFIIWTTILLLCNIGMMTMYPTLAAEADSYSEMISKEMQKALSMDQLNFALILHYFAYVFVYIILFGGVYAMLLGASIVSREENEKTIEFLLAKPVTRRAIITQKALVVLFYIALFNVIFIVGDFFTFEFLKQDEYSIKTFMLMHVGFFLLQLTFASLGLFISIFITKAKTIYPITFGIVLGAFFLNVISAISDKLEVFKHFTPFNYINPSHIAVNSSIEIIYIAIMFTVIIVSVVSTYLVYDKKDISV
ncbi:UNVERIFIED_CONTAM: ABC-2 type transport system permease protein [Acetivibrio alkalicellulosi]